MMSQSMNAGVIPYSNTGAAIEAGDVIDLVHRAGVALVDIAATTGSGSVAVGGVYTLPKDTSTIAQTDELYWDVSAEKVTTTQGAGDPRLGIAVKAAATGDTYCNVEINAPRTVGDVTVASGSGDATANAAALITIITELEAAGILDKPA